MLKYTLERGGYEAILAGSGQKALYLLDRGNIDALIVDYQMPWIDGLDVCRAARQSPRADMPIILLTASREVHIREQANHLGVDLLLRKPAPGQSILGHLENLMRVG